jgi:hypothetical protein
MSVSHNCLDEILDRITAIEKRLDQMEKDFEKGLAEHVLNDKIHVTYKKYRPKKQGATSPPPPPGNPNKSFQQFKAPPRPRRQSSAPGRMQTPVNIDGPVPKPPPLPNKLRL